MATKSTAALSAHEIILSHPVFSLMQWLANNPSGDDVARELTLNYFQPYGATQTRLSVTDEEGTLHFVGSFGFEKSLTGTHQQISDWQARTDEIYKTQLGPNGIGWSESGKYLKTRVNEYGDTRCFILIGFEGAPVADNEEVERLLQILKPVVGIHMAAQPRHTSNLSIVRSSAPVSRSNVSRSDFSPRQLAILGGMVEGKTNHELATDLGFSVSTVRHETMRIYQLLSVSDRRDAAREALERGIF